MKTFWFGFIFYGQIILMAIGAIVLPSSFLDEMVITPTTVANFIILIFSLLFAGTVLMEDFYHQHERWFYDLPKPPIDNRNRSTIWKLWKSHRSGIYRITFIFVFSFCVAYLSFILYFYTLKKLLTYLF